MAKKKPEKPDVPLTTPLPAVPKTKPVRLDLSLEEHKKLRVVAAIRGLSMSTAAREFVREAVDRIYNESLKG